MATKRQPSKASVKARTMRETRVLDIIVRVSQRKGRDGDAFHSPKIQREVCENHCKMIGARVGRVFDESDSVSGKTTKRAGLQEAMARALKGTTDGIIVATVDRFARSLSEGVSEIKRLQEAGASFVSVEFGIDTGNASKGTNLMLALIFAMAEWQRDALIDKWNDTRKRQVVHLGIANHAPFGYRKGDDRRLVPVPEEAAAVVEMFERRAQGEGWNNIASAMNAAGVPSPTGGKWTHGRVSDVVNRRAYLGEVSSGHDLVNPNAHPPIVTQAQWDAAHARAGKRRTNTGGATADDYLLTGVLRCAACGGSMVPHGVTGNRQPRYRCRTSYAWGRCATPAAVIASEVEGVAIEALFAEALSVTHLVGGDATESLENARERLSRASAVLEDWVTNPANDELRMSEPEVYEHATHARVAAVAEARAEVERETAARGARGALPENLAEAWETFTNAEKRLVLSSMFSVIAVAPNFTGRRADDVRKRVRLFTVDDPETPTGFITTDGRGHRVAVFTPIAML